MTLPFNNNNSTRKFQCFCCGVNFTEYVEFKNHIINEHEEGQDYILCPVPHCDAPVRDLKMHFKVKHPQRQLPKSGQYKALIWKDFDSRGKKKKRSKPKFREGYYESSKMGKSFYYRSGYEATIFECLDSDKEVAGFDVEPFEIPYSYKGKAHKYTPDVFVSFMDGHKELWEIKPSSQTTLEKNKCKWEYANNMCKARGWNFAVITEKGIEKIKKKIRDQNL